MLICFLAAENGCFIKLIRLCFGEEELPDRASSFVTTNASSRTLYQDAILLVYYFIVLQVSFLSWGVLQEKVMTQVCSTIFSHKILNIK